MRSCYEVERRGLLLLGVVGDDGLGEVRGTCAVADEAFELTCFCVGVRPHVIAVIAEELHVDQLVSRILAVEREDVSNVERCERDFIWFELSSLVAFALWFFGGHGVDSMGPLYSTTLLLNPRAKNTLCGYVRLLLVGLTDGYI